MAIDMSNGDGGRFDDDEKIIDITNLVNKKSDEEIQIEEFANHFVDMFNRGIIEKQREEARKRFVHFMINFLLCTQVLVIVAMFLLYLKMY